MHISEQGAQSFDQTDVRGQLAKAAAELTAQRAAARLPARPPPNNAAPTELFAFVGAVVLGVVVLSVGIVYVVLTFIE